MEFDKTIFLKGEKIALRPLNEEDVFGNYSKWLNDKEIVQFNSHGRFPQTPELLIEFVKSSLRSKNALVLGIVDLSNNQHIGNISLQNISWIDRSAEIAFLLGEKNYWGTGVMKEAGDLLIDHGFSTLNLHRIHCGTSSENLGMQKLALKLGMEQEGVRKQALFKQGRFVDIIEYGRINNR